jgi:hypothetical protein
MRGHRLRAIGTGVVACAIVILGGLRTVGAGDDTPEKGGVEAKAAFARLKKLAGTWKAEIASGGEAAKFKAKAEEHKAAHGARPSVVFKLTGAGSALVETQFPGAPHEMVTVYHLDGGELRMTHYCAAGNQPRLKLDRAHSRPNHLVFVFDGGSNLNPDKDMHIHGLAVTFHEDGRVTSDWEGYAQGKSAGTTSFVMTRQDEAAGPGH